RRFRKSWSVPDFLVELDRVDVEVPAHLARRMLEKPCADRAQIGLKRGPGARLDDELRALEAGAPGQDVGHRVVDVDALRRVGQSGGGAQEAHRGVEL